MAENNTTEKQILGEQSKIRSLYRQVKDAAPDVNWDTEDGFVTAMQNPDNRKWVHGEIAKRGLFDEDYDLDRFNKLLGFGRVSLQPDSQTGELPSKSGATGEYQHGYQIPTTGQAQTYAETKVDVPEVDQAQKPYDTRGNYVQPATEQYREQIREDVMQENAQYRQAGRMQAGLGSLQQRSNYIQPEQAEGFDPFGTKQAKLDRDAKAMANARLQMETDKVFDSVVAPIIKKMEEDKRKNASGESTKELMGDGLFALTKSAASANIGGQMFSNTNNLRQSSRLNLTEMLGNSTKGYFFNKLSHDQEKELALKMFNVDMDRLSQAEKVEVKNAVRQQVGNIIADKYYKQMTSMDNAGYFIQRALSGSSMMQLTSMMAGDEYDPVRFNMQSQAMEEYNNKLQGMEKILLNGGSSFLSLTLDAVPFMLTGAAGNAVGKLTQTAIGAGARYTAGRGMTQAGLRLLQGRVLNHWATKGVTAAVSSGVNFGLFDALGTTVQGAQAGNLSFKDVASSFGWGSLKGAGFGVFSSVARYGRGLTGDMLEKMEAGAFAKTATKSVYDAMTFGTEIAYWTAPEQMKVMNEKGWSFENVDWSSIGENLAMMGMMHAKGNLEGIHKAGGVKNWFRQEYIRPDIKAAGLIPDEECMRNMREAGYKGFADEYDMIERLSNDVAQISPDQMAELKKKFGSDFTPKLWQKALVDPNVPQETKRQLIFVYTGKITNMPMHMDVMKPMMSLTDNRWTVTTTSENGHAVSSRSFKTEAEANRYYNEQRRVGMANQIAAIEATAGNVGQLVNQAMADLATESGVDMAKMQTAIAKLRLGMASTEDAEILKQINEKVMGPLEQQRQYVIETARDNMRDEGIDIEKILLKDCYYWTDKEWDAVRKYNNTLQKINEEVSVDKRMRNLQKKINSADGNLWVAKTKDGREVYVKTGLVLDEAGNIDADATSKQNGGTAVSGVIENGEDVAPVMISVNDIEEFAIMDGKLYQETTKKTYSPQYGAQVGNIVDLKQRVGSNYVDVTGEVIGIAENGTVRVRLEDGTEIGGITQEIILKNYTEKVNRMKEAQQNVEQPAATEPAAEQQRTAAAEAPAPTPQPEPAPEVKPEPATEPVAEEQPRKVTVLTDGGIEVNGEDIGAGSGVGTRLVRLENGKPVEVAVEDITYVDKPAQVAEQQRTDEVPATAPQPAPEPVAQNESGAQVKLDAKGMPDMSNEPDATAAWFVRGDSGLPADVNDMVLNQKVAMANKDLEKAMAKKPNIGTDMDFARIKREQAAIEAEQKQKKAEADYWNAVAEGVKVRRNQQKMQEDNQKMLEAREKQRVETRIKKVVAEIGDPTTIREAVLMDMLKPGGFGLSKEELKKELGSIGDNVKKEGLMNQIARGERKELDLTIQSIAEGIASEHGWDVQQVRDEIIDVLTTYAGDKSRAVEELEKIADGVAGRTKQYSDEKAEQMRQEGLAAGENHDQQPEVEQLPEDLKPENKVPFDIEEGEETNDNLDKLMKEEERKNRISRSREFEKLSNDVKSKLYMSRNGEEKDPRFSELRKNARRVEIEGNGIFNVLTDQGWVSLSCREGEVIDECLEYPQIVGSTLTDLFGKKIADKILYLDENSENIEKFDVSDLRNEENEGVKSMYPKEFWDAFDIDMSGNLVVIDPAKAEQYIQSIDNVREVKDSEQPESLDDEDEMGTTIEDIIKKSEEIDLNEGDVQGKIYKINGRLNNAQAAALTKVYNKFGTDGRSMRGGLVNRQPVSIVDPNAKVREGSDLTWHDLYVEQRDLLKPVYKAYIEMMDAQIKKTKDANVRMQLKDLRDNAQRKMEYLDVVADPNFDAVKEYWNPDRAFDIEDDTPDGPVFYSNASRAVEGIKQDRATAEQWLNMIKNGGGLKAGEDKWIGLSKWLESKKGEKLTKQEVLDYINDHMIKIEDVTYSENGTDYVFNKYKNIEIEFENKISNYVNDKTGKSLNQCKKEKKEFFDRMWTKYGSNPDMDQDPKDIEEMHRLESEEAEAKSFAESKKNQAFEEMSEKYGNGFKDAFELTRNGIFDMKRIGGSVSDRVYRFFGEDGRKINSIRLNYTTEGLNDKKEIALVVPEADQYFLSDDNDHDIHFGDAGDGRAVAWIRFGETTDSEGKKVLVIDEIQSKRHQDGREIGYRSISNDKYYELNAKYDKLYNKYNDRLDEIARNHNIEWDTRSDIYKSMTEEETKEMIKLNEELTSVESEINKSNGVPDAPFEKNWSELAMKRMLRYAADNGYDKVAWTTGRQQSERYDISGIVDKVDVYTDGHPASGDEASVKKVHFEMNGREYTINVNREGNIVSNTVIGNSRLEGKHLSELFGKEIADEIMQKPAGYGKVELGGREIGGEGMKAFYDKMLPSFMNKYGKKFGVQVGEVELPEVEVAGRRMHAIDVTPELVESVKKGQPQFDIDKMLDVNTDLDYRRKIEKIMNDNTLEPEERRAMIDKLEKRRVFVRDVNRIKTKADYKELVDRVAGDNTLTIDEKAEMIADINNKWNAVEAAEYDRVSRATGIKQNLLRRLERATGIRIVADASEFNSELENGFWDRKRGTIYINPKGNRMANLSGILGHETLHPLEDTAGYDDLAKQLLEIAYKDDGALNAAIMEIQKRYDTHFANMYNAGKAKTLEHLSWADAKKEVVANVLKNYIFKGAEGRKMLDQAIDRMEDKSMSGRFCSKLRDMYDLALTAWNDGWKKAVSKKTLMDARDHYADLAVKYREENNKRAQQDGTVIDNRGDEVAYVDEMHNIQMNLATYDGFTDNLGVYHEGTRARMSSYFDDKVRSGLMRQEDKDRMMDKMDYWADYMRSVGDMMDENGQFVFEKFREWNKKQPQYRIVGKEAEEKVLSTIVQNGEYPVNLELTTDCIKRETFTQLLNEIVKMHPQSLKNLNPREITIIQDMMKSYGIQTACPLCFVEGKRLMIRHWAQTIADNWNVALAEAMAKNELFGGWKPKIKTVKEGDKERRYVENIDEMEQLLGAFGFASDDAVSAETWDDVKARKDMTEQKEFMRRINSTFDLLSGRRGGVLDSDMKDLTKAAKKASDKMLEMENAWRQKHPNKEWTMTVAEQKEIEKILADGKKVVFDKMKSSVMQYPELRRVLKAEDLIGNKGLDALRGRGDEAYKKLFSMILSSFGTGTPKVVQRAEPYAGEIMERGMDSAVNKAEKEGGWRLFSFSDFDITKIFDIMQIFWGAEARGAKLQSYSKEVPYILFCGRGTNAKINMSTLVEVRPSQEQLDRYNKATEAEKEAIKHEVEEYAGLTRDENGKITGMTWSGSHSVSPEFAEAIFHDDEYNANCGATTVGVSVNHTLYSMMTPWLRQVIPFHLSGMPIAARERTDVGWYRDATKDQNTGVWNGEQWVSIHSEWAKKNLKDKDGKKVNDFNFYEGENNEGWDLRQRCRDYVKWCKENGYRPKFEWALNADNYVSWCKENGYEPNAEILQHMRDHETEGVYDNYYKVIADFNPYKPVFDNNGNYTGDVQAPHKPIKSDFVNDQDMLDLMFGVNNSMLANRERNIEHGNRMITKLANDAIGFLTGKKSYDDIMSKDPDAFRNTEDAELYLKRKRKQWTIDDTEEAGPVRSRNFKRWFGDWEKDPDNASKVVDENGKPLVVYHYTNGKEIVNKKTGEKFDDLSYEDQDYWQNEASDEEWNDNWEERDFEAFDTKYARRSVEVPGIFFSPSPTETRDFGKRRIAAYMNLRNPAIDPKPRELGFDLGKTDDMGEQFMNYLIKQGYDGIIVTEGGKPVEYVAFYPEQIKSVNNNGEFDPKDKRFSYDIEEGETENQQPRTAAGESVHEKAGLTEQIIDERLNELKNLRTQTSSTPNQVQKWVGGYHPEEFGITEERMKNLYEEGQNKKIMDITYDDNGNLIPLSERFDQSKRDLRYDLEEGDESGVVDEEPIDYKRDAEETERLKYQELVSSIEQEAANYQRELDWIKTGGTDKGLLTRVRYFVRNRLNLMTGTGLGPAGINNLMDQLDKVQDAKDIEPVLQQIQYTLNKAELKSEMDHMLKTLNTKTQSQTQRGLVKGVGVDSQTNQVLNDIRGSFKQMITTDIDERIKEVNRQIRDLKKEYGISKVDEGNAEFQTRYRELRDKYTSLVEERSEAQKIQAQETEEMLTERQTQILDEMNDYRDKGQEIPVTLVEERIALPIRMELAKLAKMQNAMDKAESDLKAEREALVGLRGDQRTAQLQKINDKQKQLIAWQRRCVLMSQQISRELSDLMSEGKSKRAEAVKRQIEEENELIRVAIDAVKKDRINYRNQPTGTAQHLEKEWSAPEKVVASLQQSWKDGKDKRNELLQMYNAPVYSFNFLLKYLDRNHGQGDGPLYRMLMKDKGGAVEANDNYAEGLVEYGTRVEDKVREIFGMDMSDLMDDSNKRTYKTIELVFEDEDGSMYRKPVELTKGQAMYVWLMSRQKAYEDNLIADGWTPEKIEEARQLMGDKYQKLAEWITEEFLPQLRADKYNPTYERLYGTSMHMASHYFPAKIWDKVIHEKGELGEHIEGMPSAATGNLISRKQNTLPLDTDVNALDMLMQYGKSMERWNAMSDLTSKLNVLMHSNAFRNYIEANDGPSMWQRWKDACDVVTNNYQSKESNELGQAMGKLQNSFMAGAIGYRYYTALKQTLSYPAFSAYTGNLAFQAELLLNIGRTFTSEKLFGEKMQSNFEWAMKNLPGFRQRVASGDMGIEGLNDDGLLGGAGRKFNEYGMAANKWVDARTVAAGARAVYNYEYNQAKKQGLPEEECKRLAKVNAEICFNESQQSSRPEFSSPMQKNRDMLSRATVAFQNSNISYRRGVLEGVNDIIRARSIYNNSAKDAQAKAEMRKQMSRGVRKVLNFGALLPGLWYIGSNISTLWAESDDDDEKDKFWVNMLANVAMGTLTNGSSFGPMTQALYNSVYKLVTEESQSATADYNPLQSFELLSEIMNDAFKTYKDDVKTDGGIGITVYAEGMANWMMRFSGINPETWANMAIGLTDMLKRGKPELQDAMFVLNVPGSHRKEIVNRMARHESAAEYMRQITEAGKLYEEGDKRYSKIAQGTKILTDKKRNELLQDYLDASNPEFATLVEEIKKFDKDVEKRYEEIKEQMVAEGRYGYPEVIKNEAQQEVYDNGDYDLDLNALKRMRTNYLRKDNGEYDIYEEQTIEGRKVMAQTLEKKYKNVLKECQKAAVEVDRDPDKLNRLVNELMQVEAKIMISMGK